MSKKLRECYERDPETGQTFLLKFDFYTNELISRTATIVDKRDTSDYFGKGVFYTMTRSFDMFLEEKYDEYNKLEFVILSWLRRNITDDNYIRYFRQAELAERFKTKQPNVSESLKKLEKDGIITKDKKRGLYIFNPKYIRYIFGDDGLENAHKIFEQNYIDGDNGDEKEKENT